MIHFLPSCLPLSSGKSTLLGLLVAGLFSAGAGQSAFAQDAKTIRYQTSWVPNAQFASSYVADAKGYYAAAGLAVTILPGGPDVDVPSMVASGAVDIGVVGADNVALANAQGANLVIVAAGLQSNPLAMMSLSTNPIETPADMYGKTIGVPTGDNAAHQAIVAYNKLDAAQFSTAPAGFDMTPLLSGAVDGMYGYYTEQTIAIEGAGLEPASFLLADYGLDVFAQAYFVRRDTLETRRDDIVAFLRAEARGLQYMLANVDEAVDLTVNVYAADGGLKAEETARQIALLQDLIVTDETKANGLMSISARGIERNIATLTALGVQGADASLFDTSLITEVFAAGPQL
jgi:ABC-type nitrate/sulfonate/bicarbonate transport system substrate-binding protein